ncbi:MAG: uracil-DNA glycosylase family protein [Algicola sp.]|nr:uracil-DNA glycosylase family protein [Algicola sp.]
MFIHQHPYQPFIPKDALKLIVGTLPPPRFTTGNLKPDDVNFCYGSRDGQLWKILNEIFELELKFENTAAAIQERKRFLERNKIGICDIVEKAERTKIDASDLGMQHVKLRNMLGILKQHPTIETLLFMGGNSKNGPEYFFRKHIKPYGVKLEEVCNQVPRIYQFLLPNSSRVIQTVSLTAPSGSANRAVGSMALYKQLKQRHANFNTLDFRVMQYRPFFK